MTDIFEMFGATFLLIMGLMTFLWVIYCFVGNSSIVDVGWALGFVTAIWTDVILGNGDFWKKMVLAIMVSVWGLRLAFYLFQRVRDTKDDLRYLKIKNSWGSENQNFKFLGMFLFQGMLVVILSTPFIIVCHNPDPNWYLSEAFGILLWGIGLLGEAASDWQLKKFNENSTPPTNKVLHTGLWKYSRHPNYFFECLVWFGFFLFAWDAPGGPFAIISPVIILFLVLKVSGIPPTEEHSVLTKGDEYREYQRTTSAFIPWFRKK